MRRRAKGPVDDRRGEEDSPPLVLACAVREQELGRRVVVDLDAESCEEIVRLVEDPAQESVVEEAQSGPHRASSGGAGRGA